MPYIVKFIRRHQQVISYHYHLSNKGYVFSMSLLTL